MNTEKVKEKRIDEIKRLSAEAGLSVSEVFREAKVPYSTVGNWDRKEPEAFTVYDTLKATIERIKREQEEALER